MAANIGEIRIYTRRTAVRSPGMAANSPFPAISAWFATCFREENRNYWWLTGALLLHIVVNMSKSTRNTGTPWARQDTASLRNLNTTQLSKVLICRRAAQ